jgi:hypothetical protein
MSVPHGNSRLRLSPGAFPVTAEFLEHNCRCPQGEVELQTSYREVPYRDIEVCFRTKL